MFPKSCDELYQCRLSKKKFLGSSTRYLYLFPQFIIINKDSNKKKADRVFNVSQTKRVFWKYYQDKPGKLRGFILDYNEKNYEYFGEELVLQELKTYFAKLFFQARVQEEYIAQQVIGQGNYALVLELKHLHSDTKWASKCIDKQKIETIEFGMESVKNEIKVMRILSPNDKVINLKEVYEGDSNIYLVMDLAAGGSLYSEMKNRKNLYTRNEVQKIMTQILTGLMYMHSKNVMHRDLKPENVLFLDKNDLSTIKIADFGLAAIETDYPYLYPKCGTPGFVAPEIANLVDKTSSYSSQCDIFSAGVIFHILLLGEGLFAGNGHLDILKLNKLCEIQFDDKKYQKIGHDAADLLFKMIEKNPKNRYTAKQCLEHPYFQNEMQLVMPQLIKVNSTMSPIKDNFVQYLANNNSPDLKLMRQNSNRLSIVTRTPIYAPKGSQPDLLARQLVWDEISSFSLDQIKSNSPQEEKNQFAT